MHLPKLFKTENYEVLQEVITNNPFSNLIIYNKRIIATRAMMAINGSENDFYIETHLNKANPVARQIDIKEEVLCEFLGSHTYISSSWYDHINVSTWNYEQVQIYGKVEFMTETALYNHLNKLTNTYESSQKCPITLEKMGKAFVEKEMKGAIGIKIIPTEIKIKQKLSQNRDDKNFNNIIEKLSQSEDEMDMRIAEKMKKLRS
ncbi:FMN-binding negative transcriptional regulator [Limibacter armeniacum]|uniref:FMN-binding negative transcriptional regulator n=1 Tax=Limibacter armeniacum TaxID=466084 RepID=UPI002FE6058E